MKKSLVADILHATLAGALIWGTSKAEEIILKSSSVPTVYQNQCIVPITRDMRTENGVSYGWLYDQGLVTNNNMRVAYENAAKADNDGDGFSNGEEYILGSNPKDRNSIPKLEHDMSKHELSWKCVPGFDYVVQSKDSLAQKDWRDVSTNSCPYKIPQDKKQAFYRLDVRQR